MVVNLVKVQSLSLKAAVTCQGFGLKVNLVATVWTQWICVFSRWRVGHEPEKHLLTSIKGRRLQETPWTVSAEICAVRSTRGLSFVEITCQ